MADENETQETETQSTETTETSAAPDLSFLPEEYKGDDGAWNTEGFRADYDALVAFKAQTEEAKAGLPEKPEDLAFSIGDDFEFPEGFDADILKHTDENGNEVEFDVKSMIDRRTRTSRAFRKRSTRWRPGKRPRRRRWRPSRS